MRRLTQKLLSGAVGLALGCSGAAHAQCPPPEWPVAELQRIKAGQWKIDDDTQRQALALALLPCLSHADPAVRDGLAFEGLGALLRGKQLPAASQRAIYQSQLAQLSPAAIDSHGFAKPFAALVLSEVARADRLVPFLSTAERAALVAGGADYLSSVKDYRGFATGEGWRHAVAHAADLMLQLALNPAVDTAQLQTLLFAVQRQIAPPGEHFYIYGEGDRLARPVLYAARRGLLDANFWSGYISALASPAPLKTWDDAFGSQADLARLHNVKSFLRALDAGVRSSGDTQVQAAFATALPLALKGLP
jgi:hypothetical protein